MSERRHSILILAGVAAPIVLWGLSFAVIATWPGYDPIAQSISLLADAPLGWMQTLGFTISGLLGVAWAYGLSSVLGSKPRDRALVRRLFLVQAAITLGFAILPTDAEGAPVSTIGTLHLADFYLYAITLPLTLLLVGFVMRSDPRWHGSVGPTFIAAGLVLASGALVPATIAGPLTPWLGLLERLYVAIPSVWQVGVGVVALRLNRTGPEPSGREPAGV